ncbi:MAG: ydfH 6 [Solirubrobacterales bacterium]|nr:ydfH 6 [Solirubrobacterales bacterium]
MSTGRPAARAETVAEEIRARIVRGEIAVGSWLRQEALAEEFGVSRMPIREAIRMLQAAGVVELVPNRGALVRGPTLREILDSYLVRAELEGLAAELAAGREDRGWLDELREAQGLFDSAGTRFAALERGERVADRARDEWERANDRFHSAIHGASGNRRLRELILDIQRAMPRSLSGSPLVEEPSLMAENIAEHAAVLDGIERRDPAAARAAMHHHVLHAGDLVARWFSRRNEETLDTEARAANDRLLAGLPARGDADS